jgi:hypothetical protein
VFELSTVSGAVSSGAHTYAMRSYRLLMFGVLAAVTFIFGTLAVLATIGRSIGGALVVLVAYAVWLVVGVRAQQRTAVRVTVSASGLDVAWIFGTYRTTPWQQVRRIRFLRSRWDPSRIQQIEVLVIGERPLQFFSRLSEFDMLIAQLREIQPQLVAE